MSLITKKQLANLCGISAQAIDRAQEKIPPVIDFIKKGKTGSGKVRWRVSQFGPLTVNFITEQQAKTPAEAHIQPEQKHVVAKRTKHKVQIDYSDQPQIKQHATSQKYNSIELAKVKYLKAQEDLEKVKIANQQSRGDLIPKDLIKKLFGKIYEIDQNQFKTINVSITPKISAAYNTANTTKTNEILELIGSTAEIKPNKLKSLKSDINKTLESREPDRILEMNKILEDATGNILENIQRAIGDFINMVEEVGE